MTLVAPRTGEPKNLPPMKAKRRSQRSLAIDLFAGCGGLSLGLRQAGFSVRAAVELNPKRAKTYRLNHPDTKMLERDVRSISGCDLLSAAGVRGTVDLIAGCPPCQGYSRIRRRNGGRAVRDDRNDLVIEFGRLILEVRPRAVMMENVPGLEKDPRFGRLVRSLRGSGYKVDWGILDLQDFGVPQRRSRLVLIGWRGKDRPDLRDLPSARRRTVRQAIGDMSLIPLASRPIHAYRTYRSKVVKARIRSIPHDGGSRRALPESLQLSCHKRDAMRSHGFKDVYGRMTWDKLSPTITGGCINPSKGRFLHPEKDRAISLLEAARLQTFPIWYKFDIEHGRYPIAEMIGEALPPRFARAAGEFIVMSLQHRRLTK